MLKVLFHSSLSGSLCLSQPRSHVRCWGTVGNKTGLAVLCLQPNFAVSCVLDEPCPSVCEQDQDQPDMHFQEPPGAQLPN